MTLTRWKMLAGVFGVSACGLVAVAGNPGGKAKPACEPAVYAVPATIPQQMPGPDAPPVITPVEMRVVETPAKLPTVGVAMPAEATPETLPTPHYLKHYPNYVPEDPKFPLQRERDSMIDPSGEVCRGKLPTGETTPPVVPVVAAPKVDVPVPAKFIQDLVAAGEPVATPVPVMALPPASPAPVCAAPVPTPSAIPPILAPLPVVAPASVPVVTPTSAPLPVAVAEAAPVVAPVASSAPADRKLKVTLQIGDTLPKFDIRDGDEVLLRVVADKVDVTSPKQRSELWATLKAAGRVKFVTPGGEGICDELQVVPGSGEVVAVGGVKFSYNWGKVETAVSSERMTFRLGNAQPLTHAPTAAPVTVPVVTPVSADTPPVKQLFTGHPGWIGGQ